MRCHEIQQLLPVRRELTWTQEQAVQAHLRDCAACGVAARGVDRTQRALRTLAVEGALSSRPPERVIAAMEARLAGHASRSGRLPARRLALSAALLALVLLAVLGRNSIIAQVRTLGLGFNTPPPPMQLYMSSPGGEMVPVDPETLEEIQGGAPLTLDIPKTRYQPSPLLSTDYSTIAVVDEAVTAPVASAQTVWILDGRTRALRNEFQLSETFQSYRLSGDGTRLAGLHCGDPQMGLSCDAWHVFDTSSGQQLSTIPYEQPVYFSYQGWLDHSGDRLYTLRLPCPEGCDAPGAPTLLSYDTATGRLAGQLELRDVIAGVWKSGRNPANPDQNAFMFPGLALSPDGRQFAIFHADVPALTLVDTTTMTVRATRPLGGKTAWFDQGVLLPKGEGGSVVHMDFSPDGRRLYVMGTEYGGDAAEDEDERPKGLLVIDVERADVIGDLMVGQGVHVVGALPDGSALYIRGWGTTTSGSPSPSLYRVDPLTLAITAERTNLSPYMGDLLMLPAVSQP